MEDTSEDGGGPGVGYNGDGDREGMSVGEGGEVGVMGWSKATTVLTTIKGDKRMKKDKVCYVLTFLSKEEAIKLEGLSTRIENIFNKGRGRFINILTRPWRLKGFHLLCDIQGWYHHHGLRPGYVREHWKKLSEIFGHKPLYYVTYSYSNAVWAFKWDGEDVLIYKNQRGLSIQVRPEFPLKKINPFLQYLKEILL